MKKRLILGDIHGQTQIVTEIYNREQPDEVVCMGDLFDPYEAKFLHNIKERTEDFLKIQEEHIQQHGEDSFVILLGNHDYQYLPYTNERTNRYDRQLLLSVSSFLNDLVLKNRIRVAFIDEINKIIFTHAGVSNTWFYTVFQGSDIHELCKPITEENANVFMMNYICGFDNTGDTKSQSCIWIRPTSLCGDFFEDSNKRQWSQFVGHTRLTYPLIGGKCKDIDVKVPLSIVDTYQNYYIIQYLTDDGVLTETKVIKSIKDDNDD